MPRTTPSAGTRIQVPAAIDPLWRSWRRSLAGADRSPNTIEAYRLALGSFSRWCEDHDRPVHPAEQRRDDVESFAEDLLTRVSPGTVGTRLRGLRAWFRWLEREEEITRNPMKNVVIPTSIVQPPPVYEVAQLKALLAACKGKSLLDRRDLALVRVLIDTGMRRGELAGLTIDDVDLEAGVLIVRNSKTRRGRVVPIGAKAVEAVDRYLRIRPSSRHATAPNLWLGVHGPFTGEGIRQAIAARAKAAGIDGAFIHRFRHTLAHQWLAAGGEGLDLVQLAGWSGTGMLARYGASAAAERARLAHRRLSPGDQL